jgi:hypothetical protein
VLNECGGFTGAGEFPGSTRALDIFLKDHGPSAADLTNEAAGGAAAGARKWTMTESIDAIMSDALEGEPA